MSEPILPSDPDDLVVRMSGVGVRRTGNDLLAALDWAVELDERWVVLGPNGVGKTTLLRLAAAELHPTSGTVDLLGDRIGKVNIFDLRPRIGFTSAAIAQRVPGDELVGDVVVSAGYAVMGRWREQYDRMDLDRATELLGTLGIAHLAERTFGTLSEGERKRVLIARSLMTDPELLLLDEPAAGLDLGGREDLVARLSVLAMDPDALGDGAGHPPRRGDPARVHPRAAAARGPRGGVRAGGRRDHQREPVQDVRPGPGAAAFGRAVLRPPQVGRLGWPYRPVACWRCVNAVNEEEFAWESS